MTAGHRNIGAWRKQRGGTQRSPAGVSYQPTSTNLIYYFVEATQYSTGSKSDNVRSAVLPRRVRRQGRRWGERVLALSRREFAIPPLHHFAYASFFQFSDRVWHDLCASLVHALEAWRRRVLLAVTTVE